MARHLKILLLSFALAAAPGCTIPVATFSFVSPNSFTPAAVERPNLPTGYQTGEATHSKFYLWELPPLATIEAAVADALRKSNADYMTDVDVFESTWTAVLWGQTTVRVRGLTHHVKDKR